MENIPKTKIVIILSMLWFITSLVLVGLLVFEALEKSTFQWAFVIGFLIYCVLAGVLSLVPQNSGDE